MEKKRDLLQTQRLVLKAFEECDRQRLMEIFFSEEIKKTYMIPDFSDEKHAEGLYHKLLDFSRSDDHFVYGIYVENSLIGYVNDCGIKEQFLLN